MNLEPFFNQIEAELSISGSKSESNRLLILQQLFPNLEIENLSNSDDTRVLQDILSSCKTVADVHHAGTAMRFLTAFYAVKEGGEVILKGSDRMHNRPIKILVDALRSLGADINYLEKEGYPPLRIKGKKLTIDRVELNGSVSSQYVSALMLIAPSLPKGLTIQLLGEITSVPYIEMTLQLLSQLNVNVSFKGSCICICPKESIEHKRIVVESDWSSASYWYSTIALSTIDSKITLSSYRKNSLQGDAVLAELYAKFGVQTTFYNDSIVLQKKKEANLEHLLINLQSSPDIAQTVVVTCFALGISCDIEGLHTLKIKETDRLIALQKELSKLGASITVTNDSLSLVKSTSIHKHIKIQTYNDHRMAMAFAPLALKVPITILDADVVSKSYPNFWIDFKSLSEKH